MSDLNPYDLVGMRKAAERGKCPCCELEDGLHLGSCRKAKDDLLSLAGQLAEAARRHLRENTAASAIDLNTQVVAWDAAQKGRK